MPAEPSGRKILVVDDEVRIAETLKIIFSTRGFEVRVAHSAEEAFETVSDWKPDLALVDVMLPAMNGIDFGLSLKEHCAGCLLLLISGHPGTTALLDGAREQGHQFDILAKPLHPALILDTVDSLLPSTA